MGASCMPPACMGPLPHINVQRPPASILHIKARQASCSFCNLIIKGRRPPAATHKVSSTSSVISQLHARLHQQNKNHISSCMTAAWLHPHSCRSSYILLAPATPPSPASCLAVLSDNLQRSNSSGITTHGQDQDSYKARHRPEVTGRNKQHAASTTQISWLLLKCSWPCCAETLSSAAAHVCCMVHDRLTY